MAVLLKLALRSENLDGEAPLTSHPDAVMNAEDATQNTPFLQPLFVLSEACRRLMEVGRRSSCRCLW